jgi:hypothetical protein
MLKASVLIRHKNFASERTSKIEHTTSQQDLIGEIRHTIEAVVKILQHGIEPNRIITNENEVDLVPGSRRSKLKYALCYEYLDSERFESDTNNIFIISSEHSDIASYLDPKGLIFNLLKGLFSHIEIDKDSDETKKNGLQSLLVSVKFEDRYYSFHEGFDVISPSDEVKHMNFNDLYKRDCKYDTGGTGISILNDSPMALFFRLSELHPTFFEAGKVNLIGKAVLVVTCDLEPIVENFLSFMSNEKVRLLLLIKEDLLKHLRNKFESDAFTELLQFRHENEHKDSMGHMVKDYWRAMQYYLDLKNISEGEIEIIKFIKTKIQTHLGAKLRVQDYDHNKYSSYDKEKIRKSFENLMIVPHLSHLMYKPNDYELFLEISNPIKCHHIVFDQVMAELIINMRRAADKLDNDIPLFRLYTKDDKIFFENNFNVNKNLNPQFVKKNGGKEMCIRILNKLKIDYSEQIIEPNIYQFAITLNLKI